MIFSFQKQIQAIARQFLQNESARQIPEQYKSNCITIVLIDLYLLGLQVSGHHKSCSQMNKYFMQLEF